MAAHSTLLQLLLASRTPCIAQTTSRSSAVSLSGTLSLGPKYGPNAGHGQPACDHHWISRPAALNRVYSSPRENEYEFVQCAIGIRARRFSTFDSLLSN